ncbi:glycosyltransferase [Leptospira ryugenii]|uniref:Glycosyltransferase n=1 Tax=Leptospira ryugenii TaxID=1917863 RepID=A0A2P2DZT2_9LEPT|nr:glycosyltransferase family 2 protein [Leptospira ryugenii]GBF50144.1 glycosyltransferase [Leptospira ryugenii]
MLLPLSATIITLNEEDNLERTLKALSFIEDIVIVDSGSTDKTLHIASSFPAKILHRKFDTYANQKNYALAHTKYEWVLALDADEVVSDGLREEIIQLFSSSHKLEDSAGFLIPRLTNYMGTWIRYSGFYPNYQLRLFQKDKGKFGGGLVHERVQLERTPQKLSHPLHHYSYKNISDHLRFIDRYSSLFAEEEFRKGKRSGILWAFGKGFFKAFYMYWIRLGILDGKEGFVLATLGFYYNFLKYLKLYEKGKDPSISSFFVMIDPVHNVEGDETAKEDGNQIHI